MTATPTIHQIILGDLPLTYTLTRKSVKRINLRIGQDGHVRISAPHRLSHDHIEAFMRERAVAILRAIRRAEARAASAPAPLCLTEGEEILLFGKPLRLKLERGKYAFAAAEDALILTLPDPDDPAALRRLFSRWQESVLRSVIEDMAERHLPAFTSPAETLPTFRFRCMTSRWGSCRPAGGIITLNTHLAGAPLPCVEYVLIHELTHLHHPDHSPRFYAELAAQLPDWQSRKAELDSLSRRLIPQKNGKTSS